MLKIIKYSFSKKDCYKKWHVLTYNIYFANANARINITQTIIQDFVVSAKKELSTWELQVSVNAVQSEEI